MQTTDADVRHIVRVQGWELAVTGGETEPDLRIRDLDLGARLGYANPIDIRKLVRRLMGDGKLKASEVLATAAKTTERGGRPGTEFWLSEAATLKVIAKSETAIADAILDEVIRVYILARRGLLPSQAALPAEVLATLTQVAQAVVALSKRLDALESGGGAITRAQAAVIRHQVATVARKRVAAGLAPSVRSARTWVYNRVFSVAAWTGTGRSLAIMPASRFSDVLAELHALEREVTTAIEALANRQLTLAVIGKDESEKH